MANQPAYVRALTTAVRNAKAPGAAAYVGTLEETLLHDATGLRQRAGGTAPANTETLYDLASLTKVVATTSAIMLLVERGELRLDQKVSEFIPLPAFEAITLKHCITHTTGLPAFKPLYKDVDTLNDAIQRIASMERSWTPGTRRRYSDFGFIILGKIVEVVAQDKLDAFCKRAIFEPLGMKATGFRPDEQLRARAAATEDCAWRDRIMVGEVHDENAFALGGVSGHAGLFSTAGDLGIFCRALLAGEVLKLETLDYMLQPTHVPSYPWQGIGWKVDGWMRGSEGYLPSRRSFGHTGWTGTALWLDRDENRFAILLSNTCHPSRNSRNNRTLRQNFFVPVAADLYPKTTNVHTGLSRVVRDGFDELKGKRLGLLTNHAARDHLGRPIVDVFRMDSEIILQRLFSPEHGFHGQAEAGEQVNAQRAPIEVVSLYGEQRAPKPEQLRDLEAFVIDLPDIGARYYTYMATMKDCMIACATAGVPVVVLDRPNPLGGTVLEGPIAQSTGSLVCCAEIPIRHGMTLGELALFFREHYIRTGGVAPQVMSLDNWPRDFQFHQCALPWTPPSPNIPTAETALLYVGTCLFEGLNVSEGRGTDAPFALIGAPWIDADKVLSRVDAIDHPGLALAPAAFTPVSMPGKAASPKFMNETCNGFRITLADAEIARPFRATAALIAALHDTHREHLEWKSFFDTLAGGPWLRQRIQAGATATQIVSEIQPQLRAFDHERPRRYVTREQILAQYA